MREAVAMGEEARNVAESRALLCILRPFSAELSSVVLGEQLSAWSAESRCEWFDAQSKAVYEALLWGREDQPIDFGDAFSACGCTLAAVEELLDTLLYWGPKIDVVVRGDFGEFRARLGELAVLVATLGAAAAIELQEAGPEVVSGFVAVHDACTTIAERLARGVRPEGGL